MTNFQPEVPPDTRKQQDGTGRPTKDRAVPDEIVTVDVPSNPPYFGPAAARALLRLLIAAHRKRVNGEQSQGET